MRVEATPTLRRLSFAPVVALLVAAVVVVVVVAVTLALTRPGAAVDERPHTFSVGGVGREALIEAGSTGRLGAAAPVSFVDWTEVAEAAGFTGRLGV
jgi:hypothetical protein